MKLENTGICKSFYLLYHEFSVMQEAIVFDEEIPELFDCRLDKKGIRGYTNLKYENCDDGKQYPQTDAKREDGRCKSPGSPRRSRFGALV